MTQGYWYGEQDKIILKKSGVLPLHVFREKNLTIVEKIELRKELRKALPGIKPEHEAKAKAKYPAGSRWITVHPGGSERGVPVLIKEHGDGTAHVIGGAGGSLNMMKLSNVKSEKQYRAEAKKREEKDRLAREKKNEAERKEDEKLTPSERRDKQSQKKFKQQAVKQGRDRIADVKKTILDQQAKEIAKIIGVKDPTEKILADIKESKDSGDKKKAAELEKVASDTKDRFTKTMIEVATEEVSAVRDEILTQGLVRDDSEKDFKKVAERMALIHQKMELTAKLKAANRAGKEIEKLGDDLAGKSLEEVIEGVNSAVYGVTGQYNVQGREAPDYEEIMAQAEDHLDVVRQSALNNEFIDKTKDHEGEELKTWIESGAFNSFNSMALSILKDEAITKDAVDALGIRNAAKVLAWQISKRGEDYQDIIDGVDLYHRETNEEVVTKALDQGKRLLDLAETTKIPEATTPEELALATEMTKERGEMISGARKIMGQALGKLEASSALNYELQAGAKKDDLDLEITGEGSIENAEAKMLRIGLDDKDFTVRQRGNKIIATLHSSAYDRLSNVDEKDAENRTEAALIKSGEYDEDGWLPDGIVSRPFESFEDPDRPMKFDGSVDEQRIENSKDTWEALHRSLGMMPEGAFAFKSVDELTPQDQYDLRKWWEENIYQGSSAEATEESKYKIGEGKKRSSLWSSFLGGSKEAAFEAIKRDLSENHSSEDMFGSKIIPPIVGVNPDDINSYRNRVRGANELLQEVDSLRSDVDNGYVTDVAKAEKQIAELNEALPGKLRELYETQLRDHYINNMSGATQSELDAGELRREKSPWGEFVRMFGGDDASKKSQEAVLDRIRGDFVSKAARNFKKVSKRELKTDVKKIANAKEFVLASLDKETRDRYLERADREMKSYQAKAGKGAGGKFVAGSRRDKAAELYARDQEDKTKQREMFSGEDILQPDGTEIVTIGKYAEEDLARMVPEVAENFRRGEKVQVFPGMTMSSAKHIHQQRAIKLHEKVKRMNLTFGTGKGKTITAIGSFANLKAKGAVNRAIFAVPSVVQGQFGNEMLKYTEPGKFKWSAEPGLSRAERIKALQGKSDMVVTTHQSLRDDMIHLMSKQVGRSETETIKAFRGMTQGERNDLVRKTLDKNGIKAEMFVVDESHYEVNRAGKQDSELSMIFDAINQTMPYYMRQSATPVKNDLSEAYDMLRKVDPEKFGDIEKFNRQYGTDSPENREVLQRLIDQYNYAAPTETGIKRNDHKVSVSLSKNQKADYEKIQDMVKRSKDAEAAGTVDVEAMKFLNPGAFAGKAESEHERIAKNLQPAAGSLSRTATQRIVNMHRDNAKVDEVAKIVNSSVYENDVPAANAKAGDKKPGVIFARNYDAINMLKERIEKDGHRVGVISGTLSGKEKEKAKQDFWDKKFDVLLVSDAGATGMNLQNASYLANYDLPDTSWLKEQRNGRIDRHGNPHDEIDYYDIVTDTEYDRGQWNRIERKAALGAVFQTDPGNLDDTGVAERISRVRAEKMAATGDSSFDVEVA
jgi:hypothetical protein